MRARTWSGLALLGAVLAGVRGEPVRGCAVAFPSRAAGGQPVVNADQTVILIWDAATKTQHFVRKASFEGKADDFGFVVPSPSQPELSESGNEAFGVFAKVTEPETKKVPRPFNGIGCGCSAGPGLN